MSWFEGKHQSPNNLNNQWRRRPRIRSKSFELDNSNVELSRNSDGFMGRGSGRKYRRCRRLGWMRRDAFRIPNQAKIGKVPISTGPLDRKTFYRSFSKLRTAVLNMGEAISTDLLRNVEMNNFRKVCKLKNKDCRELNELWFILYDLRSKFFHENSFSITLRLNLS